MKSLVKSLAAVLFVGVMLHAAEAKPPNVVLILSDDHSYTDYSFMGHPHIETPHLDQLASESALFKRGYVPTALCRPALMTLATGLYSHQNKITGNDPAGTPENAAHADKAGKSARELLISNVDRIGTVAKWIGEKGYVSHQSGKWWEGSYQRGGFTEGMTRGYPDKGGRHGDDGLKIGRQGMEPIFDFIDRSVEGEKPFFVWYAPFLPHTPHDPPQDLAAKYEAKGVHERVAKYYANIERLDDTVGLLMEKLDDAGIAEDTLVIYVTDNGWIQTETGSYADRSKRSPNEGGTRNPIMFRWPGTIPAADRPELCSSIDIVPTILAAADAEGPHDFPGLNLLPELESGDAIDRDTLYGESFAHDIADIKNPQASLLYRWVIKGNDKLLLTYDGAPGKMKYPPRGGEAQLYDLKKDPNEETNLATQNPKRVKELSSLLDEWYAADQRQVGKVTEVEPKERTPNRKAKGKVKATPTGKGKGAAAKKETAAPDKNATRPNILLLYADDQRDHTLGCAGHPIVKTPNIDRLAGEGVRFENSFVSTSTCWVGRACLFTSTYERRHLYRAKPGALDPELCETSFFAVLKDAGYRTGHLGKEHVNIADESAALMWDVREKLFRRPFFKEMEDGSTRHETQILGDWGIDFIKEQPKDQPFCLQISFNATHAEDGDKRPGIGHFPWPKVTDGMYEDQEMPLPPLKDPAIYEAEPDFLKESINRQRFFWRWDTPEKYQTNMRAYFRMISGIDHVVGRLVEQLEEQGLADNTIIVYTADNGYYLGDRGFAGKWTHYDQSLRVPLVVYDPRLPKSMQGRVLPEMALNSDVGTTLIELAGLPTPDTHTGRSLAPLIRGDRVRDWRSDFLCEFLAVPKSIPRWEGVRGRHMSYARYFLDGTDQAPQEFLYDLQKDPDQLVNLADAEEEHPHLKRMRERTDALVTEYGPEMKDIGEVQRPSGRTKKKSDASSEKNDTPAAEATAKGEDSGETAKSKKADDYPDVVFIIVDDLNDYLGYLGGHPNAISPNIDALADSGMAFPHAYCNSPQCRPSRTSLNHGVYASNTGTYFNAKFEEETKIETPTMQQFFMENGYRVASGGKVFHGNPGKHGDSLLARPKDPKPPKGEDTFNAYGSPADGYALDASDEEMSDYKVASWAIDEWNSETEKPLFMSVGFFRPHRPLQVPAPWFDKFPIDSIKRPAEPAEGDDWDDMPEFARKLARSHAHKNMHNGLSDHEDIVKRELWDETLQAYLASVAFVDAQIGRFLDALESNPRGRDTVIMLTSDHGWHLGEKKHWCKGAIWEQTLKVPFIVRAPGVEAGAINLEPVSLIDVYPSLVDLADLEVPDFLDGNSIKPQLYDPKAERAPAVSFYGEANTSIRSRDWRYIRYEDGSEELYHHQEDPNEWTNEADNPEHASIKKELSKFIPKNPHSGIKVQEWFDKYQP